MYKEIKVKLSGTQAYVRSSYLKIVMKDEDVEKFKRLSSEEQLEKLLEEGDLVINGWNCESIGSLEDAIEINDL